MSNESKEREPSAEARAAARWLPDYRNHERFALALEDCIDARIRLLLPTNCQPRDCHEYQSELIAERDKLCVKLGLTSEALRQAHAGEERLAKELESLRSKPLEGELAADIDRLRRAIDDSESTSSGFPREDFAAIDRIEAALRAKGAQEHAELEPVRVLDSWRQRDPQRSQWVVGSRFGRVMVSLQRQGESLAVEFGATEHEARQRMAELIRRGFCESVEQPAAAPPAPPAPPAAPAPELPRKVEPGTLPPIGSRCRITEVASWDDKPEHKAGFEFVVRDGCTWIGEMHAIEKGPYWIVECGTYVTGLDLVAEPEAGK